MAAPQVVKVVPEVDETDVVLGQTIEITFDQAIDTETLNDGTFSLSYPAPTQIITNNQLISGEASPSTVVVHGTWSFSATDAGATIATFQPETAFQSNTLYTAMLLGADAALSTEDVKSTGGEALAESYSWSFTTGALNLKTPPISSPLLDDNPPIQPSEIRILQRPQIGVNLTQQFDIVFPDDIDPDSFSMQDLLISIEPILGNPMVYLPAGLHYSATVKGNRISVTITGW